MRNQSLFQLLEMVRKGLFFYIGEVGALVNYVNVKDVVDALVMCGIDDSALGNTYILSQTTEVEQMVESFSSGLDIERKTFRLPELLIRQLTRVFGWLPGFPLTVSRIDALTGYCRYDSTKIIDELGFEFHLSLESRFVEFSSKVS